MVSIPKTPCWATGVPVAAALRELVAVAFWHPRTNGPADASAGPFAALLGAISPHPRGTAPASPTPPSGSVAAAV